MGYYKGIAIDRAGWNPLLEQHPEWFTAILLYGTEDGWDELERRQDSIEQHQAFAGSLAISVRSIHRYWLGQRRLQSAPGPVPAVIGQAKPGSPAFKAARNAPCPCGYGNKYKRCHGTAKVEDVIMKGFSLPGSFAAKPALIAGWNDGRDSDLRGRKCGVVIGGSR